MLKSNRSLKCPQIARKLQPSVSFFWHKNSHDITDKDRKIWRFARKLGQLPDEANERNVKLPGEPHERNVEFSCLSFKRLQWIPFVMFETLNSGRRKLLCAKVMPNVGKNLSWCALPNFKKNQKRKLVSSQIRSVLFPHLRGNFGVICHK